MRGRRLTTLSVVVALAALHAPPALAQSSSWRTWQLCTPSGLMACASVRIDATARAGGTDVQFSIANLGSLAQSSIPTAFYSFVFGTGASASAGFDLFPAPIASGGATVLDPTPWSLFDAGDALFLSSSGQTGIGGCASGPAQQGWSQMAMTCGVGSLISFLGTTSSVLNASAFEILDVQLVGLDANLSGDYCGVSNPCTVVSDVSSVPEPSSLILAALGFAALGCIRLRMRVVRGA